MLTKKIFLNELILISPKVYNDERGFFYESYNNSKYDEILNNRKFVQDNVSRSKKGTLRGLHYQLKQPQAKLISVLRGEIFDVAVDIRVNSPTYSKWFGTILSDENHHQLFVPEGFAHGFYVLSEYADVQYKCSNFYNNVDEYGIAWNDSTINIEWPLLNTPPLLSEKDKKNNFLSTENKTHLPIFDSNSKITWNNL